MIDPSSPGCLCLMLADLKHVSDWLSSSSQLRCCPPSSSSSSSLSVWGVRPARSPSVRRSPSCRVTIWSARVSMWWSCRPAGPLWSTWRTTWWGVLRGTAPCATTASSTRCLPSQSSFSSFSRAAAVSAHSQRNAVLLPQIQKLPVSVLDWRIKVSTFTRFIYADSLCELLKLTSWKKK